MTDFLKKYVVVKWKIPLLFFGLCLFIFLNGAVFPNTDFGFYLFVFATLVLLISSIWHIRKGTKKVGFALLSTSLTPIFALGFMTYLFAGTKDKLDGKLALDRIEPLIEEKTNLVIPKNFVVLENLVQNAEGAFDSDYSIVLTIEYQESDEKSILKQILNPKESDKGSWENYIDGFDFNGINGTEPFYFKVDTLNNKMELNLSHL